MGLTRFRAPHTGIASINRVRRSALVKSPAPGTDARARVATEGDIKGSRPGMLDILGRAKWSVSHVVCLFFQPYADMAAPTGTHGTSAKGCRNSRPRGFTSMRSFGSVLLFRGILSLWCSPAQIGTGPAWLQGSDAGGRAAEGTRALRDRAGAGSSGDRCAYPFCCGLVSPADPASSSPTTRLGLGFGRIVDGVLR